MTNPSATLERLLRVVGQRDLKAIEQHISQPDFTWEHVYESPHHQGVLFALFPPDLERKELNFSKECLKLFLKHGYTPHLDDDLYQDFLTETPSRMLKQMAQVLQHHPQVLADTFEGLAASVPVPWYKGCLEHFISPVLTSQLVEVDDRQVSNLFSLWQKMEVCEHRPFDGYDLYDFQHVQQVFQTTHALLDCSTFVEPPLELMILMKRVCTQYPDLTEESQVLLAQCATRVEALVQKMQLLDAVQPKDISDKTKRHKI